MLCIHRWKEKERITSPPIEVSIKTIHCADALRKLICGTTTIIYQCEKCGTPHTIEIVGVDRSRVPFSERIIPRKIDSE